MNEEIKPTAWLLYDSDPAQEPEVFTSKAAADHLIRQGIKLIPVYAHPPEHNTNGVDCWCDPEVRQVGGSKVVIHQYDQL